MRELSKKEVERVVEAWVVQAIKNRKIPFYAGDCAMDLKIDALLVREAFIALEKEGKIKKYDRDRA